MRLFKFTNARAVRDMGKWLIPLIQLSMQTSNTTIDPFADLPSVASVAPIGTTGQSSNSPNAELSVLSPSSPAVTTTTEVEPTLAGSNFLAQPTTSSVAPPSPAPSTAAPAPQSPVSQPPSPQPSNGNQTPAKQVAVTQTSNPQPTPAKLASTIVSLQPGQSFRIRSRESQLLVSIPRSSMNAGTSIVMESDNSNLYAQVFNYLGTERFQLDGTDLVLMTVPQTSSTYSIVLATQMLSGDNERQQRFRYDNNRYEVISLGTSMVFNANNQQIIASKETGQSNQLFNLESV